MARRAKQPQEQPSQPTPDAVWQGRLDQQKADSGSHLLSIRLECETLRDRCNRMAADRSQLPEGWNITRISDTKIRVNANTQDGQVCHWILDTEIDT